MFNIFKQQGLYLYLLQTVTQRKQFQKLSILIPLIYKLDWVLDMFSKAYIQTIHVNIVIIIVYILVKTKHTCVGVR